MLDAIKVKLDQAIKWLFAKTPSELPARPSGSVTVEPPAAPDLSKGRQQAPVTPLFTTAEGKADDLKKITGVGPALERKLTALGVTRYDQIAAFSDEDVEKVDTALNYKGRVTRDDWVGQAKTLAGA